MKHIVIVGFGDTGLLSAIHLPKTYKITAISTKALLVSGQELGSRLSQLETWKNEYLMDFAQYRHLEGVNIVHGKVEGIDPHKQSINIHTFNNEEKEIDYDALLIATGVNNGFWRTPNLEDKEQIQRSLEQKATEIANARKIDIIGGGASAVNSAFNIKKQFPEKSLRLFYPGDTVLKNYPKKVQLKIQNELYKLGIELHSNHRLKVIANERFLLQHTLEWSSGQKPTDSELSLLAIGASKPNTDFLSDELLDEQGYVLVNQHLQSTQYNNIFSVGDVAASDTQRCSARNDGFKLVAHNIDCFLKNSPEKMKDFKPVDKRWGSILGVQKKEGLRVFTPQGQDIRIPHWWVKKLIFPFFVRKLIYKGVKDTSC